MTDNEKANKVVSMLDEPDVAVNDVLPYIAISKEIVLSKRYPFGNVPTEVPERYEEIQCLMALELFNKRGAEGQNAHNENGINRQWADSVVSPTLLKLITPRCESVIVNENA